MFLGERARLKHHSLFIDRLTQQQPQPQQDEKREEEGEEDEISSDEIEKRV